MAERVVMLARIVGGRHDAAFLRWIQLPQGQEDVGLPDSFVPISAVTSHVIGFDPLAVLHRAELRHFELFQFHHVRITPPPRAPPGRVSRESRAGASISRYPCLRPAVRLAYAAARVDVNPHYSGDFAGSQQNRSVADRPAARPLGLQRVIHHVVASGARGSTRH
jgi:hypothetical protein